MALLELLAQRESGCIVPQTLERIQASEKKRNLWISESHQIEKVHFGGINSLDIEATNEEFLLSAASDGKVAIHDMHNVDEQNRFKCICSINKGSPQCHTRSVERVTWYPHDTGMFVTSGGDKRLKVWDTNSLSCADEYQFEHVVYCHDLSPIASEHSLLAVATQDNSVKLLDLRSGASSHTLSGHSQDNRVLLWDVRRAKSCLRSLDQHNGQLSNSTYSGTAHGGFVLCVEFTPDGAELVSVGGDDHMRLWDAATGLNRLVNFGRLDNFSKRGLQIAISGDTSPMLAFVPAQHDINVYELRTGHRVRILRGHYAQVNACAVGHLNLVSGGNDRNLLLWSAPPSQQEAEKNEVDLADAPRTFLQRTRAQQDNWSDSE